MSLLSQPIEIGGRTSRNRIVMPPIVLFKPDDAGWEPDDSHIEHYCRRAAAGTGLIIVEATAIDIDGRLTGKQLRISDDAHIPHLAKIAEAIKAHGTLALIQIHHAGLNTTPEILDGVTPAAPSAVRAARWDGTARELASDEIEALIRAYAQAAVRAKKAGFDGVELHGAHGYLMSQFLSPAINKRTDKWGGPNLNDRLNFPLAVVRAAREAVGPEFIVGYRLGVQDSLESGLTLPEGIEAAKALEATGCLDILNISSGMGGGTLPEPPPGFPFSYLMYLGSQVKKAVNLPVIAVGGIKTGQQAEEALRFGVSDMVAVAKAMLADPDWSRKALAESESADGSSDIETCLDCSPCRWFRDGRMCPRARARAKRE